MAFQRARSQEQIEQRRDEIIKATVYLYDKIGFEKLNISVISKETGLTRPTIYNYFNTKEEILIQVIVQEFKNWTQELIGEFKLNKIYTIEEIAQIWAETLSHHARFMDLYSILFSVLERNCSIEILAQFKREILAEQYPIINLITQLIPDVSEDDIYSFLLLQLTSAIGLYPMSYASEDQKKAIELSDTGYKVPDFIHYFKVTVYQQLYCLKNGVKL